MSNLQTELAVLLPSVIAFLAVAVKVITQISAVVSRLETLIGVHVTAQAQPPVVQAGTYATPAPPAPGGPEFREG